MNLHLLDICSYLDSVGVRYSHYGEHATETHVNMECPFCPGGDHSDHLGINVETKQINCWRCGTKGTAIKLIMKLERISFREAIRKIESLTSHRKDITQNRALLESERRINATTIRLPEECQDVLLEEHRSFLDSRRFDPDYVFKKYDLRSVRLSVDWKHRLIIPVKMQWKLVTWTSRDVTGQAESAYKHLSNRKSIIPINETLYNLDRAKDAAIVTEGVLDVWRVGDGAVCTFGTNYTRRQLLLLSNFQRVFILFDFDAKNLAKNFASDLALFVNQIEIIELDQGDPADMSEKDVEHLRREVFGKIF